MKKMIKKVLAGIMTFSMCMSLVSVDTVKVKADDFKYVVMNIPYSDFYNSEIGALNLKGIEQQTASNVDAITTATTSKFKATSGLAKGTYYDTNKEKGEILGLTFPVKMSSEDYDILKDTYRYVDSQENNEVVTDVKGSYFFKDYVGDTAPAVYKTLTYNDGSYIFSESEGADGNPVNKDASKLEVTNLTSKSSYGDYQITLSGVKASGTVGDDTATVYGTVLVDSENQGYAMYALDNLWLTGRGNGIQVAWSVKYGRGLKKGHGQGDAFYQYDMNGKTLSKVIVITNTGNYTIECNEKLPKYYEGDLSSLKCRISRESTDLSITGVPEDLENVKVSVSGNLATSAEIVNGKVALSSNPEDGKTYTVTVSSSNYCDISYSLATPISNEEKVVLQKWIDKANAVKNNAENKDEIIELIGKAEAMITAGNNTSVEAEELISRLMTGVKKNYRDIKFVAEIKGNELSIITDEKLDELENSSYKVSYSTGRWTTVFASGQLTDKTIVFDKVPTVGTEYTVTISADNIKDSSTTAKAEEKQGVITKGETRVNLKDYKVVYNGKAINLPKAEVSGSTGLVKYEYYEDAKCTKLLKNIPIDAGTYYVIAKVAEDEKYDAGISNVALVTILKASSSINITGKTVTYNGKKVQISQAKVAGSSGKVEYKYYADKNCTKELKNVPVNAGTYYVKAWVSADKNYNGASSSAVWLVIKKANQKVSKLITSKKVKYSLIKKKNVSFMLKADVLGKAKVSYKKISGNKNLVMTSQGTVKLKKGLKKGTYIVKYKVVVAASANYNGRTITQKLKIIIK